MDRELDKLTSGEIAIRLFTLRKEYNEAQEKRATAAGEMNRAELSYNVAQERFREAVEDERDYADRLRRMEAYLESRLVESETGET